MHTLGMHHVLRPLSEGLGLIFTLHRVRPAEHLDAQLGDFAPFNPNGLLEVTPDFLDATLDALKASGMDIVSLDEALEAIKNPAIKKGRFAVFTFDDGYRDNWEYALPVLEAHNAPAVVYVPSEYPQGRGELWWVAVEQMIRQADSLVRPDRREDGAHPTRTAQEKLAFYLDFYWALRAMGEDEQRATVRAMAADQDYDILAICRDLIMDTQQVRTLVNHELITIGGHTMTHRALAKLPADEARAEMVGGADWLEETLGRRPQHFSFPYGDPGSAGPRDYAMAQELGFKSAVTTRKGMLYSDHKDHMFGLPRVSLNGDYQDKCFVELFASGAPFLLANKFKKVA